MLANSNFNCNSLMKRIVLFGYLQIAWQSGRHCQRRNYWLRSLNRWAFSGIQWHSMLFSGIAYNTCKLIVTQLSHLFAERETIFSSFRSPTLVWRLSEFQLEHRYIKSFIFPVNDLHSNRSNRIFFILAFNWIIMRRHENILQ